MMMIANPHNMGAVPRMNVSFNVQERDRLERLAKRLGIKYSRALAISVTHTLASLELRESIHVEVPSEQEGGERR